MAVVGTCDALYILQYPATCYSFGLKLFTPQEAERHSAEGDGERRTKMVCMLSSLRLVT